MSHTHDSSTPNVHPVKVLGSGQSRDRERDTPTN